MASRLRTCLHLRNWRAAYFKPAHGSCQLMKLKYSTFTTYSDEETMGNGNEQAGGEGRVLQPQGVDPKKGWNYRGVHKAIICGKVGQTPVQKILRNGRAVTTFTVGTAGLHDQRFKQEKFPRPLQWHRIAVHNEMLGAYVVQRLVKDSPVYVEGDIEIRVYNDAIDGKVKSIPEICVRQSGKIRLIDDHDAFKNNTLADLDLD